MDAENVHDEAIADCRNNDASSSSAGNKVDVIDKNETSKQCDETSDVTSYVNPERKNEELPQEFNS